MWHRCKNNCAFLPSRLARALWIEILSLRYTSRRIFVEARESLVDRNYKTDEALLKAVSRGSREPCGSKSAADTKTAAFKSSRLARALWIEMTQQRLGIKQLSSRLARALWIEMICFFFNSGSSIVEARESLVDRNSAIRRWVRRWHSSVFRE